MNVPQRSTACLLLAAAVLLSGCPISAPPSIKPTPPLVTSCLVVPTRQLSTPERPPDPLTDEWAKRAWAWMSGAIGLTTADREDWQGERDCVREKAKTGAIR